MQKPQKLPVSTLRRMRKARWRRRRMWKAGEQNVKPNLTEAQCVLFHPFLPGPEREREAVRTGGGRPRNPEKQPGAGKGDAEQRAGAIREQKENPVRQGNCSDARLRSASERTRPETWTLSRGRTGMCGRCSPPDMRTGPRRTIRSPQPCNSVSPLQASCACCFSISSRSSTV